VKDLATRRLLMRSNSLGDLYLFFGNNGSSSTMALSVSFDLWHRRLGHPSSSTTPHFPANLFTHCNSNKSSPPLCDACQLGKSTRIPFSISHSKASAPFDLIHCDLWTSPIISCSGYKYYLIVLDDFSHYSWAFPLRAKSETCDVLIRFFTVISTQFHTTIKCL
jgi:histone deacetylase 1/2